MVNFRKLISIDNILKKKFCKFVIVMWWNFNLLQCINYQQKLWLITWCYLQSYISNGQFVEGTHDMEYWTWSLVGSLISTSKIIWPMREPKLETDVTSTKIKQNNNKTDTFYIHVLLSFVKRARFLHFITNVKTSIRKNILYAKQVEIILLFYYSK